MMDLAGNYTEITMVDLYTQFMNSNQIPVQLLPSQGVAEDIFYLNNIGQLVINRKINNKPRGLLIR